MSKETSRKRSAIWNTSGELLAEEVGGAHDHALAAPARQELIQALDAGPEEAQDTVEALIAASVELRPSVTTHALHDHRHAAGDVPMFFDPPARTEACQTNVQDLSLERIHHLLDGGLAFFCYIFGELLGNRGQVSGGR